MKICPRCHRTIVAEKFRDHLAEHKWKRPFQRRPPKANVERAKTKYAEFEEFTELPGFENLFEKWTASKPVMSNLSEDQIRVKFENSLRDVDAKYVTLRLEAVEEPTVTEVWMDEQRNVVLKYNPLSLGTLTEKAIDGLLLHEACHVCTLPDTLLHVRNVGGPEMVRFLGNSITNYEEYLAHVEFVKRFRTDPRYEGLKEHQTGLLTNFEIILNSLRMMAEMGRNLNQFWILEHIGAIIYDSMFFFASGDDSFLNWCKSHSIDKLACFVGWFYEDFEYIRKLDLSHKEAQDKVMAAATLSLSVNPMKLLLGQIEFADTTKRRHEEWRQKGIDTDLVDLWEKRRQLYQKS